MKKDENQTDENKSENKKESTDVQKVNDIKNDSSKHSFGIYPAVQHSLEYAIEGPFINSIEFSHVQAREMTAEEFFSRSGINPGVGAGYLVIDKNNNKSWRSKKDFESSFYPDHGITFSEFINGLNIGNIYTRAVWKTENDEIRYIVSKQVESTISIDIIPKMQSLNEKTKEILLNTLGLKEDASIKYHTQYILIDLATGAITYYMPSSYDMAANDYIKL